MRLSIGAILIVTVPDTIIRSEWRGEAHGTIPKRSTSKRDANVAIISIAQQARPNVTGHIEDFRAQLKSLLVEDTASHPPGKCSSRSQSPAIASETWSPSGRSWWDLTHSWRSLTSSQAG